MKIEISGIKTPINAVQADLGFDSSKLEVVSVSTDGSFANIFVQKEIDNEGGYVRLTGGLPNPGFFSDNGVFGTIFFRGKEPGIAKINYLPSSMVLANNGRGTNILKDLASISYLILPERISQEDEDMQKKITEFNVLGESTSSTQMKFYDETSVLGENAKREIKKKKFPGFAEIFLGSIEKFDRFILEQWGSVLGKVF